MRTASFTLCVLLAGCGSRSDLISDGPALEAGAPFLDSGGPRPTVDAGPTDAGRPVPDAAADAAPDAPIGSGCELTTSFTLVTRGTELRFPALARTGDPSEAMLVFTDASGSTPEVWALPIESSGESRGVPPLRIAEGEGGTLVGKLVRSPGSGFTLSFRDPAGSIVLAGLDPLATAASVSQPGPESSSRTPLLVVSDLLVVNGWERPASGGQGSLQRLDTFDSIDLSFAGTGLHGALGPTPDRFRVGHHDGARGVVEERDGRGRVLSTVNVTLDATTTTFPVATGGIRVDEEGTAILLWGGTVRAVVDGLISLFVGGASAHWFLAEQLLQHVDAAYDPRSGWYGAVAAVSGTRDGSRISFFALRGPGEEVELEVVTVPGAAFAPLFPAILDTGADGSSFLIVWADNAAGGSIRGARIVCE